MGIIPTKKIPKKMMKMVTKAIESTAEPIMIIEGIDTKIMKANKSTANMFRCSQISLTQRSLIDFCPTFQPHMRNLSSRAITLCLSSLIEEAQHTSELRISKFHLLFKDELNEEFWAEVSACVYYFENRPIIKLSFEPKSDQSVEHLFPKSTSKSTKNSKSSSISIITESCDFSTVEDGSTDIFYEITEPEPIKKIEPKNPKKDQLIKEPSAINFKIPKLLTSLKPTQSFRTENKKSPRKKKPFYFDFIEFEKKSKLLEKLNESKKLIREKLDFKLEIELIILINKLFGNYEKIIKQKQFNMMNLLDQVQKEKARFSRNLFQCENILLIKLKKFYLLSLENNHKNQEIQYLKYLIEQASLESKIRKEKKMSKNEQKNNDNNFFLLKI
ncbi:hypothetical protein M0811_11540 [Anaeramoeba ignava]|uniref:Uncharacterized protein n=1 Tax=Anaeramoeba ignava TaxID=1746090 RepID=A0A9Q0LE69_ANAIG|nr:hypothetical protein M0811_11540 [Anaeramoeba ignava]